MIVEEKLKDLQKRVQSVSESILDEVDRFNKDFAIATKNTKKFLRECKKVGIKLVSLGTKTDLIPRTKTFPFGPHDSIFAEGEYAARKGDTKRPAIRSVAEKFEEGTGCGNTGQHSFDLDEFVEGVYEFKKGCRRKVG